MTPRATWTTATGLPPTSTARAHPTGTSAKVPTFSSAIPLFLSGSTSPAQLTLLIGQAAPDAITLTACHGELQTLATHRTAGTHSLGLGDLLGRGIVAAGREEQLRVRVAAGGEGT